MLTFVHNVNYDVIVPRSITSIYKYNIEIFYPSLFSLSICIALVFAYSGCTTSYILFLFLFFSSIFLKWLFISVCPGTWHKDSLFGHKKDDSDKQQLINMQKSKSSTNVGQVFSKKIWKSRSKSQTRTESPAQPHWTPQVSRCSGRIRKMPLGNSLFPVVFYFSQFTLWSF